MINQLNPINPIKEMSINGALGLGAHLCGGKPILLVPLAHAGADLRLRVPPVTGLRKKERRKEEEGGRKKERRKEEEEGEEEGGGAGKGIGGKEILHR